MVSTRSADQHQAVKQEPAEVKKESAEVEPMDTLEALSTVQSFQITPQLRKMVAEAEHPTIIPDETWYLISSKWFAQLKAHLAEGAMNETTNPGTIDNSDIIVKFDGKNELRETALEKADYDYVSVKLWELLIHVFGGEEQEIPVKAYENHLFETKLEVHPLVLNFCLYPDLSKVTPIHVSRFVSIAECTDIVLEKLDLSSREQFRYWIFSPNGTLERPDVEMTKPISELELTVKHLIMLEKKTASGAWILDETRAFDKVVADLKKHQQDTMEGPGDDEKKSNHYNLRSQHSSRDPFGYGSGTSKTGGALGLIGLGNLGNTCFMNSSLQCLSNVPELTDFFRSGDYKKDINVTNPLGKKGEIAKVYADLVEDLWHSTASSAVYPSKFKGTLSRHTSLFNGSQQDAQESLQYIVDCLHEDLNRIKKKPYIEDPEDDPETNHEILADKQWKAFRDRNDSVIFDLFYGQIRSSLKCPDCDKLSVKFDPVCYYSLPLPTNQMKKLSYIFVPYDATKNPSAQKIIVPKAADVSELLKRVSEQIFVAPDYLVAVTVYDNRVTTLKKDSSCEDFTDRDTLFIYQTSESTEDARYTTVFGYVRRVKNSSVGTLCDYPFVLSLPSKGLSARKLYHLVYTKLCRRLQAPIESDMGSGSDGGPEAKSEEVDYTTNGENRPPSSATDRDDAADSKMEDDTEADQAPDLPVPPIFTLSTINSYGNHENKQIKNADAQVTFEANRVNFLSVNFSEAAHQKFYRKESNLPVMEKEKLSSFNGRGGAADVVELRDCFQLYISPERLSSSNLWRCPSCKEEKAAMKKLDLWRMPPYMFVHLKRFQYSRFYREKLSTSVHFPRIGLDLTDFVMKTDEPAPIYDLVGVSCHSGGLGGGHYWAVCQNKDDKEWYKFDDSRVNSASDSDIDNEKSPYILVFKHRTKRAEMAHSVKMEEE